MIKILFYLFGFIGACASVFTNDVMGLISSLFIIIITVLCYVLDKIAEIIKQNRIMLDELYRIYDEKNLKEKKRGIPIK